ncbi:hypothetical protein HDU98_007225 [Podochytrium sp. JEL0797]|nr:hypothetical protein HDU98_007225 [Podochytrium sp. JEL0797]
MPWFSHPNVSAVIFAMLPGQESGAALADVLFGDVNPSGRIPFTVLKDRSEYAADVLYASLQFTPQIDYEEGVFIDYRHADKMNITPIIPFGHGLSYTKFEYSDLRVMSVGPEPFSGISVAVSVRNVGERAGHEVVQLYVSYPDAAKEPPKILEGFEKVFLGNGETADVVFNLTARDLRVWEDGWKNIKGRYNFLLGASSRDIRVEQEMRWG